MAAKCRQMECECAYSSLRDKETIQKICSDKKKLRPTLDNILFVIFCQLGNTITAVIFLTCVVRENSGVSLLFKAILLICNRLILPKQCCRKGHKVSKGRVCFLCFLSEEGCRLGDQT